MDSSFTGAGNQAFGVLVAFISGRNSTRGKVAMTAPVVQEQASTKIQMTSPVVQESGAGSGRHVVAFVMPAEFTLDTLPTPSDPRIKVRRSQSTWPRSRPSPDAGRSAPTWSSWPNSAPLWSRPASRSAGRPGSPGSIPRGLRGSSVATRSCCPYSGVRPPGHPTDPSEPHHGPPAAVEDVRSTRFALEADGVIPVMCDAGLCS